jgi:hypothetical protein
MLKHGMTFSLIEVISNSLALIRHLSRPQNKENIKSKLLLLGIIIQLILLIAVSVPDLVSKLCSYCVVCHALCLRV